jgi:NodT family efflux transporter outer membrane factor (OMF) lipoprotein
MRRAIHTLLGIALCSALYACKVGPEYVRPADPQGAGAPLSSVEPAAETGANPPDDWWHLYSDARLDGLIDEALRSNRDLAVAQANLQAAAAVVSLARAGRYPSTLLAAGGIYGRDANADEILEFGGHEPENLWLLEDVLQVGYEVDLFGRVRRSIEAAHANAESVGAARDSVKIVVVAAVARAYAQVCALGEQIAVARHSLNVVSHEAEIALHRHEAGANSQFDVVRAQALEAQVRSAVPPLDGRRRAALFELTALLGRTPADAPLDLQACASAPRLGSLIPVGDGAAMLRRRPDVRQAERRLAAATAQTGVVTADLYPTIRLSALLGGAAITLSDLVKNGGLTWGIGPSISWNFPNQTGPRARIRQAKALQAAALAEFDAVILGALKETEQALSIYAAALDNRQALSEAQRKTHQAFGLSNDEFLAGSSSTLELLTSEQSLIAVDADVAAADAALIQDQIAVFKALGGGWQVRANGTGIEADTAQRRDRANPR